MLSRTAARCVGRRGAVRTAAPVLRPRWQALATPPGRRKHFSGGGAEKRAAVMSHDFMLAAAASVTVVAVSLRLGGDEHRGTSSHTARCDHYTETDRMIDKYVENIWTDKELIQLPLGLGKSAPLSSSRLCRAMVSEVVRSFDATIDQWNHPQFQSKLLGHPVLYLLREDSPSGRRLVHHVSSSIPFDWLELTADVLVNDPRVAPGVFPKAVERHFIKNILHVLGCILMDVVLSTSVSIQSGAFHMNWTYDKAKQWEFFEGLEREDIKEIVQGALKQIDFELVREQSHLAVGRSRFPGEKSIYNTAYIIMLIMFYMFNMQTECIAVGRSVQQQFINPSLLEQGDSEKTIE